MTSILQRVRVEVNRRRHLRHNRHLWPANSITPLTAYDADAVFQSEYDDAQAATQMADSDNPLRRHRHYVLHELLSQATNLPGDFAECGCWRGLSSTQICRAIAGATDRFPDRRFFIFDSFEGLSEFVSEDRVVGVPIATDDQAARRVFAASEQIVRNNLAPYSGSFETLPGWIPERFAEVSDREFAFVNIDVDLFEPTRDSLAFFWPRLVERGIILVDDYGFEGFPGCRQAVDEFLATLQPEEYFFFAPAAGNAFLVKL